jgi:hypothetical protein
MKKASRKEFYLRRGRRIIEKLWGKTWPREVRALGYQDELPEEEMVPSYPAAGSEV